MEMTTIAVTKQNRDIIEEIKKHPRETPNDVLTWLIEFYQQNRK